MTAEEMISETLKKGFDIFKKNYVNFILGTIVALFLSIFIVTIAPMIFGVYYMAIELMKGKRVKVSDVFKGFDYFFVSWGILLLAVLAVMAGLVFLVVPGLLLMVLFQYAVPIAILEKKGVWASLKRSYHLGRANLSFSIVLWLAVAVINSVGAVTRIGFLITVPFTALWLSIAAQRLKT